MFDSVTTLLVVTVMLHKRQQAMAQCMVPHLLFNSLYKAHGYSKVIILW